MKRFALAVVAMAIALPVISDAQIFTLSKEQMIEYTTQNPFDRFADGRPKVPDGLIERAKGLSAEEVWAILPSKGFRNQYADGFQILHPKKRLVGRAFTLQFMPLRPDLDSVIQAKAQDDYGVRQLDLVYSVNGGPEKTVTLFGKGAKALDEVSAGHTIYMEELGVKPGDFVAYYAKAQDNDTVKGPKVSTSDIYFVKIRPFNQNF